MLAAEPDAMTGPTHTGSDVIAVLHGLGGQLILRRDRLQIERHGVFFSLLNLGYHVEREIGTTIFLRELVAVHLVRSFLLVQFLRFTYAGCPMPSGQYLRDAFAENAYLLSLRDNRPLLTFMRRIEAAMASLERNPVGNSA